MSWQERYPNNVLAGHLRWVWCPACKNIEFSYFVHCTCHHHDPDGLPMIYVEVPTHLVERIESVHRLAGWAAAQAIADTWEEPL